MASARLSLEDIVVGQQSKEVLVNENNRRLDAWFGITSRSSAGPPGSPVEGSAYIVDLATGDWSGFTVNDVVIYYNSAWRNMSPTEGPLLYVDDEDLRIGWDGSAWVETLVGGGINEQTVSYEAVLTDAFKYIRMDSGSAQTFTVPASGSVAYALGTSITIRQSGTGALTIQGAVGVTLNGSATISGQHDYKTVVKVDVDEWDVY